MPDSDDRAGESPTLALVRLSRRAELEVARLLEPHGLTVRKHRMLELIAATPGVSHAALARSTGMETRGIPAAVRALTQHGLVRERREGGVSGVLSITADGSALLRRLEAELARVDAEVFATDDLREVARAVLAATAAPDRAPQD